MTEEINHPEHYNQSEIEPVDVWDDWGMGIEGYITNILKYLCRGGHKPGAFLNKDMAKVRWYINRAITQIESGDCAQWRGAPVGSIPWETLANAWKLEGHLCEALQHIHQGRLASARASMDEWINRPRPEKAPREKAR